MGPPLLTLLASTAPFFLQVGSPPPDTIRARLDVSAGQLAVEVHYPRVPVGLPALGMSGWAGVDFAATLEGIAAEGENGEAVLLQPRAESEWVVSSGGGAFTVRYGVRSDKNSLVGNGSADVWRPLLTARLVAIWGASWFLRPLNPELAALPVQVELLGDLGDLRSVGSNDTGGTGGEANGSPVGTPGPAARSVTFPDSEQLVNGLLLGGELRRSSASALGLPVRLTAQGDQWTFSDDELLQAAVTIVSVQANALRFLPGADLDVVLVEGSGRDSGGLAEGTTILLYPDPALDLHARDPETLRILAHEHLHRWIGEFASSTPARGEGRFKWFQEGVTEYLAFGTLARGGLIDTRDFVFKVNQYIDRYVSNPASLVATAEDMERAYWTEPEYQRLAYEKGFLLAMSMDARIQAQTDGERSIWDFVAAVVGPDGPGEYDDDILLAGLVEVTGQEWADYYEAYALGAVPLDLLGLCQDVGLDCRRDRGGTYRLLATDRSSMRLAGLIL